MTDVRKISDATILFRIPVKRFFDLRRLRKGLPLRIRIVGRGGMPFLLKKLYRRPVLWIGSALMFISIAFLSSRIWFIKINDTKRVDPDEILGLLSERGIHPGTYLEGPILITAANDLSAQVYDAAWIGLDRKGVVLTVNVVESIPESPKRKDRIPSDIIAEKEGIVTSIQVMRGQANVKIGDHVSKGTVLISGEAVYKEQYVNMAADGIVYAAVQYRAESVLPESITEAYETETTETVQILRVWNHEIMRTKPQLAHYRLIGGGSVSENGLLPVSVETLTAREIAFRERTLSTEEAEEYALADAREKAFQMVPREASIINIYGTIRTENGKRLAVVIVTADEIIGKTEERSRDG